MATVIAPVLAHVGLPPGPHDLLRAWSFDPLVIVGLAMAAYVYTRGLRALWRSAGVGQVVSRARAWAFVAAMLTLVVALVSPVDAAGNALFVGHMVQHLLLALIAAPLLAVAAPWQAMVWALSPDSRRRVGRWQGRWRRVSRRRAFLLLVVGVAVYTLSWWTWHVPPLYDAAVRSDPVHALEHASVLGGGLVLWAPVLRPRRLPLWAGLFAMAAAAAQGALLAALLTFATRPWYGAYSNGTGPWGLSRLQDQALGGVMMWVFASPVYVLVAVHLVFRWLNADERNAAKMDDLRSIPATTASTISDTTLRP